MLETNAGGYGARNAFAIEFVKLLIRALNLFRISDFEFNGPCFWRRHGDLRVSAVKLPVQVVCGFAALGYIVTSLNTHLARDGGGVEIASRMKLPIAIPFAPMDALLVSDIPEGPGWQYEPKWDGFRCLAFRDGTDVQLQSKSGQPLTRYFPELVEAFRSLRPKRFVLDGEIAVPVEGRFSFDMLLQRIHPAESRVRKLAKEYPTLFIAFDLLVDAGGDSMVDHPLRERRAALERFSHATFHSGGSLRLSPATIHLETARRWFKSVGGDLDGLIAKRLDLDYRSGERNGMEKVKQARTADCVIGGFRYAEKLRVVGSLLLGLYDEAGLLDHVGFCSGLTGAERKALLKKLEPLKQAPGFTGKAPGGLSRWSTKRSREWEPLKPKLVIEVSYDHFTGGRFRHGTKLLRWRPDKAPRQCTFDQIAPPGRGSFALLQKAEPELAKAA